MFRRENFLLLSLLDRILDTKLLSLNIIRLFAILAWAFEAERWLFSTNLDG